MHLKIKTLLLLAITNIFTYGQNATALRFANNGIFRIVQLTDIHYKTNNKTSDTALVNIEKLIDKAQPDLLFFTGDIVVDKNIQKAWDEVLDIAIKRKIPWAVVFGNHDDEKGSSRTQIMEYILTKPYCYAQFGPKNIKGVGNYILPIKANKTDNDAAILYAFDSHAYSKIVPNESYGYLDFSQINWYNTQSAILKANNNGKILPALAFMHIPLQEYALAADSTKYKYIGTRLEKECYGALNTGMYAAMMEAGDVMGVFVGHDHVNDYIANINGICLAYGRFSGSKTTYGTLANGIRVIELHENKKGFESWILTSKNEQLYNVTFDGEKLMAK